MTAEEKLLAEIFHVDGSKGTPDDARIERVTDFLAKVDKDYSPNRRITVGDLTQLGRDYARRVLSGAEGTTVYDEGGVQFYWKSPRKYAPSIVFTVGDSNYLVFDRCGWFTAAINYDNADDVLPVLGFNPKGDNENASPIWGNAHHVGNEWRFSQSSAKMAKVMLLGVPWGGAHSSSRGLTKEEAEVQPNVIYFEKQTSKGGGEGVDYYLINIEPDSRLQKAIYASEKKLMASDAKEAQELYVKYLLIRDLDRQYNELKILLHSEEERLHNLCVQVEDEVLEELENMEVSEDDVFLISDPEPDSVPEVRTKYSYDSSLQELMRESLNVCHIYSDLALTAVRSETRIRRYRQFAPDFGRLSTVVRQKCFGWTEIYGDEADVLLPNRESAEPEMIRHRFGYTEKQVGICIKMIQDHIDGELKAAKENITAIIELLKK